MSELHSLGVSFPSHKPIESVHPQFLQDGMQRAREKSWAALHEIRKQFTAGLTEKEGREIAKDTLAKLGCKKGWHQPYVRFGAGTVLTFRESLQPDYRLREGDPYFLDLGPVWADEFTGLEYEGDVGDTFILGDNPEAQRCAATARELWQEARQLWIDGKTNGVGLYAHLSERAKLEGYEFLEKITGHRLSDFPHVQYSKQDLARVEFHPAPSIWVLELQIIDPARRFGAFFEDLLD